MGRATIITRALLANNFGIDCANERMELRLQRFCTLYGSTIPRAEIAYRQALVQISTTEVDVRRPEALEERVALDMHLALRDRWTIRMPEATGDPTTPPGSQLVATGERRTGSSEEEDEEGEEREEGEDEEDEEEDDCEEERVGDRIRRRVTHGRANKTLKIVAEVTSATIFNLRVQREKSPSGTLRNLDGNHN